MVGEGCTGGTGTHLCSKFGFKLSPKNQPSSHLRVAPGGKTGRSCQLQPQAVRQSLLCGGEQRSAWTYSWQNIGSPGRGGSHLQQQAFGRVGNTKDMQRSTRPFQHPSALSCIAQLTKHSGRRMKHTCYFSHHKRSLRCTYSIRIVSRWPHSCMAAIQGHVSKRLQAAPGAQAVRAWALVRPWQLAWHSSRFSTPGCMAHNCE